MAGHPVLSAGTRWRLLAVVAVVLLAHIAALYGFSRWQGRLSLLKPMVEPMYTRLLEPQKPPEPAPAVQVAREPPIPPGRMRATPSVPRQTTRTAPEPTPEPLVTQAPEPPAAEIAPPAEIAQPEVPLPEVAPPPEVLAQPTPTMPADSTPTQTVTASITPSTTTTGTPTAAGPSFGADGWPTDTRLRYQLSGRFRSGDLYGDARVLWQREGVRYQVRVEVALTFLASLVMTSQGEVGDVLMPQVYEEVRNGKPRGVRIGEREVMLANGRVLVRPPEVQDTASQFVELSHRFATGRERLEVGRAVSFWMARPGGLDLWTYDIVEREVLRTKLGEIEAFRLKPRPVANARGNIYAEMWFAPSLQYLPVRIRVTMGEEAQIDLLVDAIEQR
jgi:hypothetical protein